MLLRIAICSLAFAALALAARAEFTILEREMIDDVEQAYVSYPSGELTVTGYLFVNPFSEHDTEPCVIFNHGGVGGVTEGTKQKSRWLAKQGYIVFAPSYRGEDDSEGEIEVADGEIDDVLAALLLLRDHPGIRPGEFVLLGTSHGALISVHVAARAEAKPLVKGVVAAYGVMDIYRWYQYLLDNDFDVGDPLSRRVYGYGPEDKPEAFAKRHAISVIPSLGDAPILILQGKLDRIVPEEQGRLMYQALRAAGRHQDDYRVYEHAEHGFLFWDDPTRHSVERLRDAAAAWELVLEFFGRVVGPEEEWDG